MASIISASTTDELLTKLGEEYVEWAVTIDKEGYDLQAHKLVKMFSDNFDVFKPYVDIDIIDAAPNLQAAE